MPCSCTHSTMRSRSFSLLSSAIQPCSGCPDTGHVRAPAPIASCPSAQIFPFTFLTVYHTNQTNQSKGVLAGILQPKRQQSRASQGADRNLPEGHCHKREEKVVQEKRVHTCPHPGLDAGAVEGDAGVEQGHRLGHEAVADGAEELGRRRRVAAV